MNQTEPKVPEWHFDGVKGGTYGSADFAGKAVLVVNTASMCGYTPQYTAMQALQDAHPGLMVLAVPSDDFHQEKASNAEVADFCEMTFGLTLPMTAITQVTGPAAHPFYAWLRDTKGFVPQWNFDKVLIGPTGEVKGTWRSEDLPLGGAIEAAVVKALAG